MTSRAARGTKERARDPLKGKGREGEEQIQGRKPTILKEEGQEKMWI